MYSYFRLLHSLSNKNNCKIHTKVKGMFNTIFGKHLVLTNTISCGVLMGAGDLIQQEIERYRNVNSKPFDWKRTGRMFVVGLTQGPPQHIFYKFLDRGLPRRDFRSISIKIIIDQLIASPVCICIFFFGMGYLEDQTWDEIISESKKKFLTVYLVDWLVWPPTQVINFYFLKPKYRVMYINIMTMLYDVFLSYIKHDV
ncbi:mpv17-like protein 2 [Zootermopsis nevadensis]|uniref:Mpv17-like protein 2 n=1 Tax=Zootermopsis nevadensis TaxID=136037 RepID=A0A067RB47_ZOONE|nr:mpv17-like protein 2 [Zootermopsis nevadensis]KDR21081.1 Mpv17-like protein 2 [Zootermopsis nevadensis]